MQNNQDNTEILQKDPIPVYCNCGGAIETKEVASGWIVRCKVCHTTTCNHLTRKRSIETWNRAMGKKDAD